MPPAANERQATLFRIAEALKEGKKIKGKVQARKIAKSQSMKTIQEFTHTEGD